MKKGYIWIFWVSHALEAIWNCMYPYPETTGRKAYSVVTSRVQTDLVKKQKPIYLVGDLTCKTKQPDISNRSNLDTLKVIFRPPAETLCSLLTIME